MQEKKLNKAVSDVKLMKTPEGKTEVKNAVKDATKKVESKVGDVAEAAAKKAEVVEEKAKEVAKATTKAVVEKAEPVVKKAANESKGCYKGKEKKNSRQRPKSLFSISRMLQILENLRIR